MTDLSLFRRLAALGSACLLAAAPGCGLSGEFFNPQFLSSLGVGSKVAVAPGNAPAVLVEVENKTGHVIEANLSFRDANGDVQVRPIVVAIDDKYSETVICPMDEATLGTLNSSTSAGAVVRLGNGTAVDPLIEVDPFGATLVENINYSCGDSITFTVQPSSAASSGYQIIAYVRRFANP